MGGEDVNEPLHELVVVDGAVEGEGEAVADGSVADVEAGISGAGEDIAAAGAGLGAGNAAVDGLGVEEGDGEAVGGELDGEGDEGVDVALVGVGDHDSVRAPRRIARHCCGRVFSRAVGGECWIFWGCGERKGKLWRERWRRCEIST